jgi:hypothetical protein
MITTDLSIGGQETLAQVSFTAGRSSRWKLIPAALAVDVPPAPTIPSWRGWTWLDPTISIGMVADWDCIVRPLVWVADGRVKHHVR